MSQHHQVVVVLDIKAPDLLTAGRCAIGILNGSRGWYLKDSDSHLESWWMPEEPLRSEVDGNDNSRGWLVFECPTCGGGGEVTECRNPGFCSHVDDRSWPCAECMGTGTTRTRTAS